MSLVSEVQIQIDEAAGPVWWTIQQVYDAINIAVLDAWSNIKWATLTTATLTMGSTTDIIPLPTTTLMIPQFIIYNNQQIFPTNHDQLQDWNANWPNQTPAQPGWYVLWDETHLRMWPPPDQSYPMIMYGVPWPPEIGTATQDILPADPLLRQSIIHRATAYLLEATQPQLADMQEQEAVEHEKKYKRQLANQQGVNILRLRPAKGWINAQYGDIRIGKKYNPAGEPTP